MKKLLLAILICLLVTNIGCASNAEMISTEDGIVKLQEPSVDEMKQYLISNGIPESYIESLIDLQIIDLYESLQGVYFDVLVCSNNEVPDSAAVPFGNIPEEDMSLSLMMLGTKVVPHATEYLEIMIRVTYEWDDLPVWKKSDAVTINWDSPDCDFRIVTNSFSQKDYYYNGSEWIANYESNRPAMQDFHGIGYYAELNNVAQGLTGTATIMVSTEDSRIYVSEDFEGPFIQATVNYVHDRNPVINGLSFSVMSVGAGVNIDTSGFYDSAGIEDKLVFDLP